MNETCWGLPDKKQEGDIFIINLKNNEKISTLEFYRKFRIKEQNVNKEFIGGIPSELLIKFESNDFIFGQCVRADGRYIFSMSRRCGRDNDNRTVTLTYYQIVSKIDDIQFPIKEELDKLKHLDSTLEFGIDNRSKQAIEKMLKAVRNFPHLSSFCSEKIYKSVYKHDWNGEDSKPPKKWLWLVLILLILLVLYVIA